MEAPMVRVMGEGAAKESAVTVGLAAEMVKGSAPTVEPRVARRWPEPAAMAVSEPVAVASHSEESHGP